MRKIIKLGFRYIQKEKYGMYLLVCGIVSAIGIITPLLMGQVIDLLTERKDIATFLTMVGSFFLVGVFQQIVILMQNHMSVKLEADAGYAANRAFIKKLYHTSYINISKEDPVMLNQKLGEDINSVIGFSMAFYRDLIRNIIFVVCIATVLLLKSPILCLVLFGLAILYGIVYFFMKSRIYEINFQLKQSQTSFFGKLYSMIFFMKSIRNNGFEETVFQQQDKEYKDYYKILNRQVSVNNRFDTMVNLISLMAQGLLFFIGGKMVWENRLSIGVLVAILNYFSVLLQSTDYFLNLGQSYQDTLSSYNRLMPYDQVEQIKDGWRKPEQIERIELKEVEFCYPKQDTLFCINQKIERGKVYWIKGKNGTGKSSFMNILLGLFGHDYSGCITMNKIPMEEINTGYMVEHDIAIIEQEPYLLADTLRKNMLCKSDSAKTQENEEELKRLLTLFEMDEFVKKQPQGLDTVYNSMNTTMSGGEKQKIAVIRMLLSKARFWLMDEPTSALDVNSTKHFYEEIERHRKDHIIVLISHEKPIAYDSIIEMERFFSERDYCDEFAFLKYC